MPDQAKTDRTPSLLDLPPEVRRWVADLLREREALQTRIIELESQLAARRPSPTPSSRPRQPARSSPPRADKAAEDEGTLDSLEPTSRMVIAISDAGWAKRTPVTAYSSQRRGGIGLFDLKLASDDRVAHLLVADEDDTLLLITEEGRAYHLPVADLPRTLPRSWGTHLPERLGLDHGAALRVAISLSPDDRSLYIIVASSDGYVWRVGRHYVGQEMAPGTVLFDTSQARGAPVAACRSRGDQDLFLATQQGRAIRFPESAVPVRGVQGIQLVGGDRVVGVASVNDADSVLVLAEDGLGTRRLMSSFAANRSPGWQGKASLKGQAIAGVTLATEDQTDIFIISEYGKLIRFQAGEVPIKTSSVQGVRCMTLRGDQAAALATTPPT
jgi:DNA gyrase subunit A